MNRIDCNLERVSNVTIGLFLAVFGILFTLIGITVLPVIGLMIAMISFILSGIFLVAPRSKACAILVQKTREVINT